MSHEARQEGSYEELLRGMQPRFAQVLARFKIPPQDAEDLLQQTLLAFVRKEASVRVPETWLVGTLRNRCLKYWRARRRSLYTAIDSAVLEAVAAEERPAQHLADLQRDLNAAVGRLRPRCRSILRLRYGLGCKPRETARRLGYRESSIYKLVERCLAALSNQLIDTPGSRAC